MADKPADYPEWGTNNVIQSVEIDGLVVTFSSKLAPTAEWGLSGAKYNENTPRQYINQQFDLLNQWVTHVDQRYAVGDVHLTTSTENAAEISARLGGTFVQRGTQSIGTITPKVWEKTA